jgi:beta-phosphoglucomutase
MTEAIKCIISDLDGTLIDNRQANAQAYIKAFGDVGAGITEADYYAHFGLRFPELAAQVAPQLDAQQLAVVKQRKAEHYRELVELIRPNEPLIALLRTLKPHHRMALATTASRVNAQFILDHFELMPIFEVFVFGEDVKAGKPDPECYKICIKRCEVNASQCLIFEDSAAGLEAAKAAGAGVIKVFSEAF